MRKYFVAFIFGILWYNLPLTGLALTQASLPVSPTLAQPNVGLEQLGLWQALVPYGSESRDRPVSQAFKEFNGLMNAFDALSTQARLGAQGGDDWVEIRRALQKDDLPRFLSRSLPGLGGKSGETRMIHFSGLWDSQRHFQLTFGQPFSPFQSPDALSQDRLNRMGDMEGIFAIEPNRAKADAVNIHGDLHMHLGTLLFSEMLASMETFHQWIESTTQPSPSHGTATSPAINPDLVREFQESVPHIMHTLNRFAVFQPEVWQTPPETMGLPTKWEDGVLNVRFRIQLDLARLKAEFPHTWRDYKLLLEDTTFESRFILPGEDAASPDTIATLRYDAESAQFSVHFRVHQGGLVTTQGRLITPTELEELQYRLQNNVAVNFYGLRIALQNINVDHHYLRTREKDRADVSHQASIQLGMTMLPDVAVSGALLRVIPPWLIDVLIPGTLESLIQSVFAKMIGSGEDTLAATFLFDEQAGQHVVHFHLRMPLPYEVVQEVFRARAEREASHPGAFKLEDSLYQTLRMALRSDFETIAGRLSSIEPEG